MYWGDVDDMGHDRIETAYLNGALRKTLLNETTGHYFAFALRDGHIYFTDWRSACVWAFIFTGGEADSRVLPRAVRSTNFSGS